MSRNGRLMCVLSGGLVFGAGLLFAGEAAQARPADAKAQANQEVLKINEECNGAELRGDVKAMNACETDDFTHIHANGMAAKDAADQARRLIEAMFAQRTSGVALARDTALLR